MRKTKLLREVERELRALEVDYTLEQGTNHWKVIVGGRMVQVIPRGNVRDSGRAFRNAMAEVKRAIRGDDPC